MLFLVVDDDELSREVLTVLLEAEGYEVEVAASGDEAVSRLRTLSLERLLLPDVILTDIQMAGLAGDALARMLRSASRKETLLVAMSGSQPLQPVLQHFDGFLMKPFPIEELQSMISAATPIAPRSTGVEAVVPEDPAIDADATNAESDVLNEEIFAKLHELMPESQLGQIFDLCISDARMRISLMKTLADSGDDEQYRREAHALKGGSGMIGASQLYSLAEEAELFGLAGKPHPGSFATGGTTGVTEMLRRLSLACERLERILVERTRD